MEVGIEWLATAPVMAFLGFIAAQWWATRRDRNEKDRLLLDSEASDRDHRRLILEETSMIVALLRDQKTEIHEELTKAMDELSNKSLDCERCRARVARSLVIWNNFEPQLNGYIDRMIALIDNKRETEAIIPVAKRTAKEFRALVAEQEMDLTPKQPPLIFGGGDARNTEQIERARRHLNGKDN